MKIIDLTTKDLFLRLNGEKIPHEQYLVLTDKGEYMVANYYLEDDEDDTPEDGFYINRSGWGFIKVAAKKYWKLP